MKTRSKFLNKLLYTVVITLFTVGLVETKPSISASATVLAWSRPVNAIASSYNTVSIYWSSVPGATGYSIYRASSITGTYSIITTTSAKSYVNTGLSTGNTYFYKVVPYKLAGKTKVYGKSSYVVSATPRLFTPLSLIAYGITENSAILSWNTVPGVSGYEILQTKVSINPTTNFLTAYEAKAIITNLEAGTDYYFRIRAYRYIGNSKVYSDFSQYLKLSTASSFVRVSDIRLNISADNLLIGESVLLTTSILPANATNKAVAWSSSNYNVATVDYTGKVTAVGAGTAIIYATSIDGSKTARCIINVYPVLVSSIYLDRNYVTLNPGNSLILGATIYPYNAINRAIRWSSTDTSVVSVDSYGRVTANGLGTATIVVSTLDGSKVAYCTVRVEPVKVDSVSLNISNTDMCIGDTLHLQEKIYPYNAAVKRVTWISSDTSVATVNAFGEVRAVGVGTAKITVITADGNKTASCAIVVRGYKVSSVELNKSEASIYLGETLKLAETVYPNNAYNKSVYWRSSNNSAATVDTTGQVRAVGLGNTTISVTTLDGSKTATCVINILPIKVESISINQGPEKIIVGNSIKLEASINPSNATNKSVSWSSSKSDIATVDSNGLVKAVGVGNVTITATSIDGNKTASCTIDVLPILVDSIKLNKTEENLFVGNSLTLEATINPTNATNKAVTWASSDEKVATVDCNGKVTAVGAGKAVITVTTVEGNKTQSCNLTVTGNTAG